MKKQIINNRVILKADAGKVITDGKELYSNELWLGTGITEKDLYEITKEEAEKTLVERQASEELGFPEEIGEGGI